MTEKVCITFNDSTFEALEKYKTKYNSSNIPEAARQIINLYLVKEEEQ